jgi:hypothetical protein
MDNTNFPFGTYPLVALGYVFLHTVENDVLHWIILVLSIVACFIFPSIVLLLVRIIHLDKKKKTESKAEEDKAIEKNEQNAMLQRLADDYLQPTKADIRNIPLSQRWVFIEKEIDKVHNHFTARLKAHFPNLKEDEIYLCCLIRIGMDSYKIIQYLDINKEYLRMKRSRLAKTLTIQNHKRQLEQFIVEF